MHSFSYSPLVASSPVTIVTMFTVSDLSSKHSTLLLVKSTLTSWNPQVPIRSTQITIFIFLVATTSTIFIFLVATTS